MLSSSFVLVLVSALIAQKHDDLNPVYAALSSTGVSLSESVHVTLPSPSMADGLDHAAQEKIIRTLAGNASSVRQFMRNSVVTKHILQMEKIEEDRAPARRADVWFLAYGKLDALANQEFLERLFAAEVEDGDADRQGHQLTADELAGRGIELLSTESDQEEYGYGMFRLIKRVDVHGTMRSYWSRTAESILFAAEIDARFAGDPKYANHWRPLKRSASGKLEPEDSHPYQGMGVYMKITQLKEPAGALFVEGHVIFSEPDAWFNGKNLLGSKLPAVIQKQIRSARREIVKASRAP